LQPDYDKNVSCKAFKLPPSNVNKKSLSRFTSHFFIDKVMGFTVVLSLPVIVSRLAYIYSFNTSRSIE